MDNLWKSILEMGNEETKAEPNQPTNPQPIQLPNPIQPTAPQQPGIDLSSLFQKPAVVPVLPTPIIEQPATIINQGTNLTAAVEVIEEDDEDDDDLDDLEDELDTDEVIDGVITPNNFTLSLPNIPATQQTPQFGLDLGQVFNVAPQTNVQKRGRGRPPKAQTAQDVITMLPNSFGNEDDKSKSNINPQTTVSQIKQGATSITAEIPKEALTSLGRSMVGIGETLIKLGS